MKKTSPVITFIVAGISLGMLATSQVAGQAAQPAGKLILWGDVAVFQPPPHPENCTVKNRFKRGEPVGFRLYALDGGTNQPEPSSQVVVHIQHAGKTYDIPALYRGVPQKTPDGGETMPGRATQCSPTCE